MYSLRPYQAYSFRCWFSNNSVRPFSSGCLFKLFCDRSWLFFSILLFQWSIFYSFFRRHCDVALFTHHLELWGSCSFRAYPFIRSACMYFLSIVTLFLCLSTPKVHRVFLVSICSTAVLSIVFNSIVFSLSTFQPLKVRGFTRLSKKQLIYLFSSSYVSLRCHPRSRDEILS